MITIKDIPTKGQEHWEVVDTDEKLTCSVPYSVSDIIGYDRVRVLKQMVDLYPLLSGCKNKRWQEGEVGNIFVLE